MTFSRVFTCRASLSLRLRHQKLLLYPCFNGSHALQQASLSHGFFLQWAHCFISYGTSNIDNNETHQRNGVLKNFARSCTDVQHSDGGEPQTLVQFQSDGKELHASNGEGKLNKGKEFALRMAMGRYSSDFSHSSSWGVANVPPKPVVSRVDAPDTIANEEPAAETSIQLKVIGPKSQPCLEYQSVVIRGRKLTQKFCSELQQKIEFMHTHSVLPSQVLVLLKKRAFLSASTKTLERVFEVLMESFVSNSIAFDVLTANAGILERSLESLKQRLQVLVEFEVERELCIKVGKCQGMWTVSVPTIEKSLKFLKGLGLDAQARNNLIRRRPEVLRQTEKSMRATVDFFESIGFCGPKLLKFLELRPSVLGASVDKNLKVKFKLLQERGFSAKEFQGALRFISQYSNEQIVLRFKFLQDQGGLPPDRASKILKQQPGILVLSIEDLSVKLDFLLHTLKRDIQEVVMYPAYLAYSFKGRIAPRFKALEAIKLEESPSLAKVLAPTTSIFKQQFNISDAVEC